MIFNLLVIAMIVVPPLIWSAKGKGYGLFSALLAAVCALAAGAIAFAAWEPTASLLMGLSKDSSTFVGNALQSSAMAIGLIGPYLLALGLLRLGVDSLVRANLDFADNVNSLGGILFGAVVSLITAGVATTGLAFLPLGPTMLGYTPIVEKDGSPVYSSKLWVPVDGLVVGLYEHLSGAAFATSTSLAAYKPDAHVTGHMQRMTFGGATRNTLLPEHFEVLGGYRVDGSIGSLLQDTFTLSKSGAPVRQSVFWPDGSEPAEGSTLQGYFVKFNSGAKEKAGGTIMGVGQIRLVTRDESGSSKAVHPVSCIAPPEKGASGFYRFRFDAPETFISSKGGASEAVFGFEFVVPPGHSPVSLLVKNIRVDVSEGSSVKQVEPYASAEARDAAIRDRSLLAAVGAGGGGIDGPIDRTESVQIAKGRGNSFEAVEPGPQLPDSMAFNKSNRGPLEISEENLIVGGEHTFTSAQLKERGIDKNLRVESFFVPDDVVMIKIQMSLRGARSLIGRSLETAQRVLPPLLVDNAGQTYEAVGFVYTEGDITRVRYTPGRTVRALSELPALSRTKTDQSLWLLFTPTKGATITSFNLGNRELASFGEGIKTSR